MALFDCHTDSYATFRVREHSLAIIHIEACTSKTLRRYRSGKAEHQNGYKDIFHIAKLLLFRLIIKILDKNPSSGCDSCQYIPYSHPHIS